MPRSLTIPVSGGVRLAVRDHGGDGRPVVIVPGGGGTLLDWEDIARAIGHRHRVVAMEPRGHGQTTPADPVTVTADALADDIQAVIDALDLGSAFVIGHSLGGLMAVLYGARHPHALGIVNVDGRFGPSPSVAPDMRARDDRRWAEHRAAWPPLAAGSRDWVEAEVERIRLERDVEPARWREAEPAVRREFVEVDDDRYALRWTTDDQKAAYDAIRAADIFAAYRATTCPVLIVHCVGPQPADVPADLPADLVALLAALEDAYARDVAQLERARPNIRVVRLPYGHEPQLEAPDETVRILLAFMAAHAR